MIIILEQALKEGALPHLDIIRTSKHQAAFRPGAASKGENWKWNGNFGQPFTDKHVSLWATPFSYIDK